MKTIYEWAEQECRIACKKENPEYNFDSDDFDYGCSCYKSALKAYKSLCEDGHSGTSWNFTAQILKKLMENSPLTPITDNDFLGVESFESEDSLRKRGLKSHIQCPRMYGLFREEYLDGKVVYTDINRRYFVDVESPSDTYSSNADFLDEMFPITMPYIPKNGKYKIYTQTFLCDEKNGDFDTKGILYLITPEGEKIDVGIYMTEKNGKMERVSKDEYDKLLAKRVDKVNLKVADSLLFTLISNSSSDKEIERREMAWKQLLSETKDSIKKTLQEKCVFFNNSQNWKYNTFNFRQSLCSEHESDFNGISELSDIHDFLMSVLKIIS